MTKFKGNPGPGEVASHKPEKRAAVVWDDEARWEALAKLVRALRELIPQHEFHKECDEFLAVVGD